MKWLGYRWFLCILLILPLTACGAEQSSSSSSGGGYKETKSMVIDILKTDEGKKAIYEALSSPQSSSSSSSESGSGGSGSSSGESGGSGGGGGGTTGIRMLMTPQSSEQVRVAVKDTITSPEYKKELEKIMTDPQFAGDFAKAINSQSKQMHMELIKDPTYRKSMEEMLKSPEVMKMFLDLTKTTDFRKQSMTVMQESMQSPIFKMEVMELLKSVVQQQLEPKVEKSGGGGQGGSGGGENKDQSGDSGSGEGS